jgi:hypothetical protein
MMKLTQKQADTLRLIDRTLKAKGGEWAKCNRHTWPLVADMPPELVDKLDSMEVRPTQAGKTLIEWAL